MKRIKKRRKGASQDVTEVFLEFATPLLNTVSEGDADEFRQAVGIATTCWNMGTLRLAGHDVFEQGLEELRAKGAPSLEAFEFLVERRVQEFPQYDWLVADTRVEQDGDSWIVQVAKRPLGR